MTIKILNYPDIRLRRIAKYVNNIDNNIKTIISHMKNTIKNLNHCGALACSQMDFSEVFRIVVFSNNTTNNGILVCINPQIINKKNEVYKDEGCMSIYPDIIYEKVFRYNEIVFSYFDENYNKIIKKVNNYFARCVQHEIDHLNGILFIDKITSIKREKIIKKIKKYKL